MQKKFFPYGKQNITSEDIDSVNKVLMSDFITQGPIVREFESSISKEVKSKYAISVNSATSALHLACLALNLGVGDYLWTSPNTFVASANCALYCGANVDFVDIDIETGLMSIVKLRKKLEIASKEGKLPKILVPVHFSGSSCEMKEIYELSKKYNFKIIEDASHAIGASYLDDPVGNCKFSDLAIFSFHPVKIITTGEGGIITTNDPKIYERLKNLRSHGITKNKERFINKKIYTWSYEQQELGFNYRMPDINASLGLSQLKRLDKIVNERNKLYRNYQVLLDKLPLNLLKIPASTKSSVHLAVIVLDEELAKKHSFIFDKMRDNNIGVQLHYIPVHTQPYYKNLGFEPLDFPESIKYSNRAFSLPLYPGLFYDDQEYISELLKKVINSI